MGLAVFALSLFIFFANINSFPLRNWDEAWYAEITKNMANGSGLLVSFWNGQYYFDKPPLYFWLSLPFFEIFGAGEWQARIISVTAAVFAGILIYLLGKKFFSPKAGFFAFLVFVTLGQIVVRLSHGNLDGLLIFFTLATFYFYILAGRKRNIFFVLSGICLGLGFLVKGWFLGLFALFVIFCYAIFVQKKLPPQLLIVTILGLIVSGWWFLLGSIKFGQPFIAWYVFNPAAGDLTLPIANFSLAYFSYFIRDVGLWFIPIILFALIFRQKHFEYRRRFLALLGPTLLFLLLINFAKEKLDWHLLLAYPFVSLLLGYMLARLEKMYSTATWLFVVILVVIQTFVVYKIERIYPDRSSVGAQLGKYAGTLIPKEDTVVLDDRDFTSFLFYSDHGRVYAATREGGGVLDWWWMRYSDLPQFIELHTKTWIISPNPESLPINFNRAQIQGEYLGYKFVKVR